MNERGLEEDEIVRGRNTHFSDNEIEHTMGPMVLNFNSCINIMLYYVMCVCV